MAGNAQSGRKTLGYTALRLYFTINEALYPAEFVEFMKSLDDKTPSGRADLLYEKMRSGLEIKVKKSSDSRSKIAGLMKRK